MRSLPGQLELFDVLYGIAARDGREEALFGYDVLLARQAFERMLIGSDFPQVYLEFPLLGAPGFDLLAGYGSLEHGARFAEGAGYGRQDLFDWFVQVREAQSTGGVGFEVDCSAGRVDVAGVYLQQRRRSELVAPFLESMGEGERLAPYEAVSVRLARGWPASYIGLFPGRLGTPTRIGGYLSPRAKQRCTDPDHLRTCLDQVGYKAYTSDMLERCSELMALAPAVDYQLDISRDGELGPTFGLSLSFADVTPREAHACMESGYGAQVMGTLERWGLADERWRLIADAAYAKRIEYAREDGGVGHLALCVRFNFAKVKFVAGVPSAAKFYLACSACVSDS